MTQYIYGKLIDDYNITTNKLSYKKDQVLTICEVSGITDKYAARNNNFGYYETDWIPKNLILLL
jgi:hypothetical protein